MQDAGVTDPADALRLIGEWTGRAITSTAQLDADEVAKVLAKARGLRAGPEEPPDDEGDSRAADD
jgi:hypothetical protein